MPKSEITTKFSEILSDLIGDQKADQKFSLGKLEQLTGISKSALSKYTNNESEASITSVVKLAKYFNVSTDYLLGTARSKSSADYLLGLTEGKTDEKYVQFICDYTGLSPEVIEKLHSFNKRKKNIKYINILLRSANFESALFYIPKYMEDVQIVKILQEKRQRELEKVIADGSDSFVDGKPIYNWPHTDKLDANIKTKRNDMLLNEYAIDKAFKYIIKEFKRIAENEIN